VIFKIKQIFEDISFCMVPLKYNFGNAVKLQCTSNIATLYYTL